ncbi:hypothetical protein AB0229_10355 [Klebsiella pneumoniae]
MKLIKYWCVQLFKAENRGMAPGNAEVLIFEGYSKDKPKIKLGAGGSFELFTAPDSLETRIFRDHLVDSVRYFPVCEDDGEKSERVEFTIWFEPQIYNCRAVMGGAGAAKAPEKHEGDDEIDGNREEQTKPPSREAMIEYIKQAIGEGYCPCVPELIPEIVKKPELSATLHDAAVNYEYDMCCNWCQNYHVSDVDKARSSSFEDVVKPVIKWLNENASAHTSVYIDRAGAKKLLLTGEAGIHAEGFIKD